MGEREQRCTATRSDGRPCGARALPGETLCWAHSPSLADKRRAAREAGGYHSNPLRGPPCVRL
jgi:hypothetical protein